MSDVKMSPTWVCVTGVAFRSACGSGPGRRAHSAATPLDEERTHPDMRNVIGMEE